MRFLEPVGGLVFTIVLCVGVYYCIKFIFGRRSRRKARIEQQEGKTRGR